MLIRLKGKSSLVIILALIIVFSISSIASAAVSVDSFIFKSVTGEYLEFVRSPLAYSYGQHTDPAKYCLYEAYADQTTAMNMLKLNGQYYSLSALTYQYGKLPVDTRSFDNAVANTTPVKRATRIARILNGVNVYEGPILTSTTSSLALTRTTGSDSKLWDCAETATEVNKSNPIGPVKFVFNKNFDRQDLTKVSIYINGVKPAQEDVIKQILFGEFYTRATDQTTTNTLDADFQFSYSMLKAAMKIYNNNTDATTFKIEANATDNTLVSITLNIK